MGLLKYFADKLRKPTIGEQSQGRASAFGSEDDANPNDFYEEFRGKGGVAEAVDLMEKYDPKLAGLMQTRKFGVLCLPREITGEGPRSDFVREVFAGIPNMHNILYDALSCISAGFAPVEKVWEEQDGKFIYKTLKNWNQDKFLFENDSWWINNGFEPKFLADMTKFSILTFQPKNNKPWGSALYHSLYWYWYLKRHSVKFWAVATERFAAPITVGSMGRTSYSDTAVRDVVSSFIKTASKTSAPSIAIPEDVEIKFVQAQQAGGLATYEKFINFLDDSMAIAVLGQTLTSNVGSSGSYSLGQIHNQIRKDILTADVLMLENFVNDQLIKPLLQYNFPDTDTEDIPKWRIVTDDAVDKESLATAIKTLVEAGFDQIPKSYISETFGFPIPDEGEETLTPRAPAPAPVPGLDQMTASEIIRRDQTIRLFMEDLRKVK